MNQKFKKMLFLALSLLFLGGAIGIYMYTKPPAGVSTAKPVKIMAGLDLSREFIRNDSLAQASYLGKVVQITGKIAEIKADSTHGIILTLDDPMAGVRCSMDKIIVSLEMKDKLSVGQDVEIKGLCAGFDPFFGVVLNRCIIVK